MTASLSLTVVGNPIPQGSKRAILSRSTQKPIVVDANRIGLADWRATMTAHAMRLRAEGDVATFQGPVKVVVDFRLRRPADHYLPINGKRATPELRSGAPTYTTTAPDIDKLCRAVLDALTDAGVWRDDAQVVELVATKTYSEWPGVDITVTPR